jgi:hypothetical protein
VPYLLRVITKSRWYRVFDWVPPETVQADALRDLSTQNGALSVWEIDDDQSNLERVLAALAATRPSIQNIDFLLVDRQVVTDLGIVIESNHGDTPDPQANRRWHRDLIYLTAPLLAGLAVACRLRGYSMRRLEKQVRGLIVAGVRTDELRFELMNEEIQNKVRAAL